MTGTADCLMGNPSGQSRPRAAPRSTASDRDPNCGEDGAVGVERGPSDDADLRRCASTEIASRLATEQNGQIAGDSRPLTPYYERDGIVLYHGDCRDIIPSIDAGDVGLLLTDPPYGIDAPTDYRSAQRGGRDYAPVHGDDQPFDPTHLLVYPRLVLFGANYYADRLPRSAAWIVWDKRDGLGTNDQADCEMAWTNLGGVARIYRHVWNGFLKASERGEPRIHPTQKPVALMAWIIAAHTRPGDLVLDPYAGSGPTLVAAKRLGRRAIGVDIEESYCEGAARRLSQDVLPLFDEAAS